MQVELTDGRTLDGEGRRLRSAERSRGAQDRRHESADAAARRLRTTVRVGDVVLALGNPLGVGQTVTMGIVSAKGRATGVGDGSFEDFLQTDAPINQGNSGGALVNTRGELIGINSQILSPSGGNIGIGFAIPANMAKQRDDAADRGRQVRRGMLGVTVQPVTSDIARSLGLDKVQRRARERRAARQPGRQGRRQAR